MTTIDSKKDKFTFSLKSVPRPRPSHYNFKHSKSITLSSLTLQNDPHNFGRIDSNGTVWLINVSKERIIGCWHIEDKNSVFDHFGRRFNNLYTEVMILEHKLKSGVGDVKKIKLKATSLIKNLSTASLLGDVDTLKNQLLMLIELADELNAAQYIQRKKRYEAVETYKEALLVEIENLVSKSTQWKSMKNRLNEIFNELQINTESTSKINDNSWKRYELAYIIFDNRRSLYFAELNRIRINVRNAKEELCIQAERLSKSINWVESGTAFRKLLTDWKLIGRSYKKIDDILWCRFKASQDIFFNARNFTQAELRVEIKTNLNAKEALLARAEKISTSDLILARATLHKINNKWKAIGKIPHDYSISLNKRLRLIEKKIHEMQTTNVNSEAYARANQFRLRAEKFELQAKKAENDKRTKDAIKARESAKQWRKWANSAAAALEI